MSANLVPVQLSLDNVERQGLPVLRSEYDRFIQARKEVDAYDGQLQELQKQEWDIIERQFQTGIKYALLRKQFGEHVVKTLRGFMTRHEAAAEHLVPALVQMMMRVVNDQHVWVTVWRTGVSVSG